MAWTTPLTAVSNTALTAAQWNASVRDNLLMTAPALATTTGRHFVSTGANTIAERAISSNSVSSGSRCGKNAPTWRERGLRHNNLRRRGARGRRHS